MALDLLGSGLFFLGKASSERVQEQPRRLPRANLRYHSRTFFDDPRAEGPQLMVDGPEDLQLSLVWLVEADLN